MKFLTALAFALPFTSYANYAACDLYKSVYDDSDVLVKTEIVSNTWGRLSENNVVLEDTVDGVSYSVTFNIDGYYILGSLSSVNSYEIKSWAKINDSLRINLREREYLYTLVCELDS